MNRAALVVLVLVLGLSTNLVGQSPIVVDEGDRVPIQSNAHPSAMQAFDIGPTDSNLRVQITLLVSAGGGRRSAQGVAGFAGTEQPARMVTRWLELQGFLVEPYFQGLMIRCAGTVSQVEKAFGVEIHNYTVDGQIYHANVADPSIPRALSGMIQGLKNLDNLPIGQAASVRGGYTRNIIHNFSGTNGDGAGANGGMIADAQGNYYGTTGVGGIPAPGASGGVGTVYRVNPSTPNYEVFYSFTGNGSPAVPNGGLIADRAGNFYGTTEFGGSADSGAFFKLTPAGQATLLYSFTGAGGDGLVDAGGLVLDSAGNFYGTSGGGTNNRGAVFKISPEPAAGCPSGSHVGNGYCETVLHNFPGSSGDGDSPNSGLVLDNAGNLYGTTLIGGTSTSCPGGCGTVFKVDPAGNEAVLYSFTGDRGDGYAPTALILDSAGNLYGSTEFGGITTGPYCDPNVVAASPKGCGTIFKLSPEPAGGCASGSNLGNGYCETVLYSFAGAPVDGEYPTASVLDGAGNLYGITGFGGTADAGTVFRLDPKGNETVLYSFAVIGDNGELPVPGLAIDGAGNLYGTTIRGGTFGDGIIYQLALLPSTTTNLALSPLSVNADWSGPVVLTATVSPASDAGTPTGTATFFNDTTQIGTASLNGGLATFNYNPLPRLQPGTYSIVATYSGDASFGGSTSSVQTLTVTNLSLTTTSLELTPSNVTVGSAGPIVMTATMLNSTATGTITFFNGTTQIGLASLNSGTASIGYNPSNLALGAYSITASYSGDSHFLGSTSAPQILSVTAIPSYTLSVSPTSLTIVAGQSGQAIFTVTPQNGFNSQVTFSCSGLPAEANCSFVPPSVTPGGNPVTSTLTITTAAATAASWRARFSERLIAALLLPGMIVVFGAAARRSGAGHGLRVIALLSLAAFGAGLSSCGGGANGAGGSSGGHGGNPGTPAGTSTVTVSASIGGAGGLSQTAQLAITITQ